MSTNKLLVLAICGAFYLFSVTGLALGESPAEIRSMTLSGYELRYFVVAANAMLTNEDIPEAKRKLENYDVSLRPEGKDFIIVRFHPLVAERDSQVRVFGGETEMGRDVEYTIDRTKASIIRRKYFK